MDLFRRSLVCTLALVGCSSPEATARFEGQVVTFNGPPLAGAQVCVDQPSSCVTTDASGQFNLPVAAQKEVLVRVSQAGFLTEASLFTIGTGPTYSGVQIGLIPSTTANALIGALGGDPAKLASSGIVLGWAFDAGAQPSAAPLAGVKVNGPVQGAMGPFYLSPMVAPDPSLQATSAIGMALFLGVPPGPVELTFTPPQGGSCSTVLQGAKGSQPNQARTLASANALASIHIACTH
jgi:hypothetical protein